MASCNCILYLIAGRNFADVQCGLPARIPNGAYRLKNSTRHYLSTVSYRCAEGYQIIGRADLICDVDGRWNGPPPRCERKLTAT